MNHFRQVRPQRDDRPRRVLREDCQGSQRGGGAVGEDQANCHRQHVDRSMLGVRLQLRPESTLADGAGEQPYFMLQM